MRYTIGLSCWTELKNPRKVSNFRLSDTELQPLIAAKNIFSTEPDGTIEVIEPQLEITDEFCERSCPQCQSPFLVEKYRKQTVTQVVCQDKECGYQETEAEKEKVTTSP